MQEAEGQAGREQQVGLSPEALSPEALSPEAHRAGGADSRTTWQRIKDWGRREDSWLLSMVVG